MTAGGRFLGVVNAFAVWLAMSFYIANLASVFVNAAQPSQVRRPCCLALVSIYLFVLCGSPL